MDVLPLIRLIAYVVYVTTKVKSPAAAVAAAALTTKVRIARRLSVGSAVNPASSKTVLPMLIMSRCSNATLTPRVLADCRVVIADA